MRLSIICIGWLGASMVLSAAPRYAPDRVIVQFDARAVALSSVSASLPAGADLRPLKHIAMTRAPDLRSRVEPSDFASPLFCRVPPGWTPTGLVAWLQARSDVVYAEPDWVGEGGSAAPADPDFSRQWHHDNTNRYGGAVPADIRTLLAWDITIGSTNVIVAVLDTGLATNHPEFEGRTVSGYDFVNDDADPDDDHSHGTAVTGIIAQNANNTNRGAGVDLQCRIMPLKVLDASNAGFYSDWASAVLYAVSNGAKVLNLSAGGSSHSTTLSNAIMQAISAGAMFVTITHNDGSGTVRFPGRMAACITVGGTRSNDFRYVNSNWGSGIDLVAPALHVRSVGRTNDLYVGSGTSFAAPQVAGVCSLLASFHPDIRQDEARLLLCAGADDQVGDPAEDTPGFDSYFGWGRLNARATLDLAVAAFADIRETAGGVAIEFSAPTNATARQPLMVESATFADGAWSTSTLAPITYSLTSGVAVLTASTNELSFHRLRVRPLAP